MYSYNVNVIVGKYLLVGVADLFGNKSLSLPTTVMTMKIKTLTMISMKLMARQERLEMLQQTWMRIWMV